MSSVERRTSKPPNSIEPSIDAVLDIPVPKVVERLPIPVTPIAHTRPSWIGPRAREPAKNMKVPVTIDFQAPGFKPPVFICTNLTDPEWDPTELEATETNPGEYKFKKTFEVPEGEYQYKFRIGPGDWWELDKSKPTVNDGMGNENNMIVVKALEAQRADSVHESPLMPHESHTSAAHSTKLDHLDDTHAPSTSAVEHPAPLMPHESLTPPSKPAPQRLEDQAETAPLLRHESVSPTSQEQTHCPLFRHESIAIDNQQPQEHSNLSSPSSRGRKQSCDSVPEEADPNDPGLQHFPTDHRGIMDHIARTKQCLAEDETSEHPGSTSPSPPGSVVASTSPSLPRVLEDEEDEDLAELERDEDNPAVQTSDVDQRPAQPMTPPITPTEEKHHDHITGKIQQKADSAKDAVKSTVEKAGKKVGDANSSTFLTGVGFAITITIAAVGLWYLKNGKFSDMAEA